TDGPADTGAGKAANKAAVKRRSSGSPAQKATATAEPGAPDPTESRPAKKPRAPAAKSASAKLTTDKKPRTKKTTKTDADNDGGEA
ncbi:MAG: NADH-quinone oxidoreductase subunit C, partial [Croceibacterium sp.]